MKQEYFFYRLRVADQHKSVDLVQCERRIEFLELLNDWNRTGRGDWVYYEISRTTYDHIKNQKTA